MSIMEPSTTNRTTRDYPRTPDGKYKYTASDGSPRHYKPVIMPGVASSPLLPDWVHNWARGILKRAPKKP